MSQSKTPRDIHLKIIKEKHEQLPKIMKEHDIDCWIIFVRSTAAILDPVMELVVFGDVVWQSAFIFVFKDNKFTKTAIVGNYDVTNEQSKGIWDEVIGYVEGISEPLKKFIGKINPKKIALNYSKDDVTSDGLTYGMFQVLSEILSEYQNRFTTAAPIIQKLRGRKSKTEIELITKACQLTQDIYAKIISRVKVGMTETEIQQMFYEEMEKLGLTEAWQRNSCPAVDAGPDKEIGHLGPIPEIKVKKGHTVHFDFGIKFYGYCSDIQRMFFFGVEREIPKELQHAFTTVYNAITKASQVIKPGVKGYEVDKVAREHIVQSGFPEFGHALGHQIGRRAHDGGVLLGPLWERYGEIPKGFLEKNMIFTLELNVKTKNFGYVSLEEDIVITKDGCKFLIPRQEKFILIK